MDTERFRLGRIVLWKCWCFNLRTPLNTENPELVLALSFCTKATFGEVYLNAIFDSSCDADYALSFGRLDLSPRHRESRGLYRTE